MPVLRPATPGNGNMPVSFANQLPAGGGGRRARDDKAALRERGSRMEAAAKALGISRKGLYLKRQRLGL
jgi:transcriptional regulator of acetoin/glycerol metabolism